MPPAPTPSKPTGKSRKERGKEREKERKIPQQPGTERLKTIIRRLPPNLPEDIFWKSVEPWVTEETTTWRIYYPGKLRKRVNKESIPSRAYIAFKNEEQLALFSRGYDGHLFRDKTGVESHAIVEFSPYPKIPTEKRKADNRNATIEKDDDYISFLEMLNAEVNPEPVSLEALIASARPPSPPKTTPLLEALKAEKSANKDREAILRNHAHYNHINNGMSRKDEKKKAGPPAPIQSSKAADTASTPINGPGPSHKKGGKKGQNQPAAPAATPSQPPKIIQTNPSGSGAKNQPAATVTPIQTPKPAKPPRAPRPKLQVANAHQTHGANNPPVVVPPTASEDTATTPVAPTVPRRSRPVIGLASRQFEAALSGVAGVGERRARREKEREKDKAKEEDVQPQTPTTSAQLPTLSPALEQGKLPIPLSPKRDRSRRGGRGGSGGANGSASSGVPQVKIPNILQRIDDSPPATGKDLNGSGAASAEHYGSPPSVATPIPSTSGGGRGGRRGRGHGHGRGRGGVPVAPRNGG